MANAKLQNDINNLSVYSHAREDEDRLLRHNSESYAQASHKLKVYLDNPYPYRNLYILQFLIFQVFSTGWGTPPTQITKEKIFS